MCGCLDLWYRIHCLPPPSLICGGKTHLVVPQLGFASHSEPPKRHQTAGPRGQPCCQRPYRTCFTHRVLHGILFEINSPAVFLSLSLGNNFKLQTPQEQKQCAEIGTPANSLNCYHLPLSACSLCGCIRNSFLNCTKDKLHALP